MSFSDIVAYAQTGATVLAILFNSFLILILCRYSRKHIGKYKWLMVGYAIFEMVYALVVFFGMPINYIGNNSWLVFNHGGFIGNTELAILGPILYCIFYEIWISLVVVHFVYRYVTLCRTSWKEKIAMRLDIQAIIFVLYLLHVLYICFCAFYLCRANEMSQELEAEVRSVFEMQEGDSIAYLLFKLKEPSGDWSVGSIASFLNHYVYVYISIALILFCGFKIKKEIANLQKQSIKMRDVNLQKQIFITLLIQTILPIFLVHIPSGVYLTLPLLNLNISFGSATVIFSFLSTLPKVIDPIIVLCGIKDYRTAVKQMLCLNPPVGIAATNGSRASAAQITMVQPDRKTQTAS